MKASTGTRVMKMECTTPSCPLNGTSKRHEVDIDLTDPEAGVELYMNITRMLARNALGISDEASIVHGWLTYKCPDTGALNAREYVGNRGRMAIEALTLDAGIPITKVVDGVPEATDS